MCEEEAERYRNRKKPRERESEREAEVFTGRHISVLFAFYINTVLLKVSEVIF